MSHGIYIPATASSIGGVLIGANIAVAGNGTISLPTTISGAITFSGAVTTGGSVVSPIVNTPSLRVGSPLPSFDRYLELKGEGTTAQMAFSGALTGLGINGLLTVQGRATLNADLVINPVSPGANYFQLLNNGQFGRPNPILYSATGVVDVQSGLYVSQNIYAVSTVSGSAWTAHGSGATLAEVREHMRQARTEQAADAKDDEPAPIPVGSVNFVADEDGFHLIGKHGEGEIWEAIVPWTNPMPPRPLP